MYFVKFSFAFRRIFFFETLCFSIFKIMKLKRFFVRCVCWKIREQTNFGHPTSFCETRQNDGNRIHGEPLFKQKSKLYAKIRPYAKISQFYFFPPYFIIIIIICAVEKASENYTCLSFYCFRWTDFFFFIFYFGGSSSESKYRILRAVRQIARESNESYG